MQQLLENINSATLFALPVICVVWLFTNRLCPYKVLNQNGGQSPAFHPWQNLPYPGPPEFHPPRHGSSRVGLSFHPPRTQQSFRESRPGDLPPSSIFPYRSAAVLMSSSSTFSSPTCSSTCSSACLEVLSTSSRPLGLFTQHLMIHWQLCAGCKGQKQSVFFVSRYNHQIVFWLLLTSPRNGLDNRGPSIPTVHPWREPQHRRSYPWSTSSRLSLPGTSSSTMETSSCL